MDSDPEAANVVDDPYEVRIMCGHRDAMRSYYDLSDGTRARPFYVFRGDDVPADAIPVQFLGEVYQEITWQGIDAAGLRAAELSIVRFNMNAEHPDFGRMTFTHDTSRPGTAATLRSVVVGQKFPVIHTTRLHVTAVSTAVPGVIFQNAGPPLEFRSEPLTEWPPRDTIYKLRTVVRFEDRRSPGRVLFSASDGAVLVGLLA